MSSSGLLRRRRMLIASAAASALPAALAASGLAILPAHADNSDVVINEVFSANTGKDTDPDSSRYDWVELKNTGTASIDVNGWRIYDEDESATKNFTIGTSARSDPASTLIPAGGYLVLYLENDPGLGKGDSVELTTGAGDGGAYDSSLQVGATVTWPAKTHASPSWARTSTGTYAMSQTATPGAANVFPDGVDDGGASESPSGAPSSSTSTSAAPSAPSVEPMSVEPWPGVSTVSTVDEEGDFGAQGSGGKYEDGNLSGLVYEPATSSNPAVLWAADNDLSPTLGNTSTKGPGAINKFVQVDGKWQQDPSDGWSWLKDGVRKGGKQLRYADGTGGVDSEGITLANNSSAQGIFIASERSNVDKNVPRPSILRYNPTATATDTNGDGAEDLSATNEWKLLPAIESTGVTLSNGDEANLGLEGVAFVPDSYLVAHHFRDASGNLYTPSSTPHFGGLFLAALEKNGHMYAVSLDEHGDGVTLVKDIAIPASAQAAGYTVIQDLYFDTATNTLMAQCDNSCGAPEPNGTSKLATYTIDNTGNFAITHIYASPDGVAHLNTEGFALASLATAIPGSNVAGGDAGVKYRQVFWTDDGATDGFSLRSGFMAAGQAVVAPSETATSSASESAPATNEPSHSASAPASDTSSSSTGSAGGGSDGSDTAAGDATASDDLASTGLGLASVGLAGLLLLLGMVTIVGARATRHDNTNAK